MKVLMLGWEFPPFISGGLGTACYGLTRGLDKLGVSVYFVLPRPVSEIREQPQHVRILAQRPGETLPEIPVFPPQAGQFGPLEQSVFEHVRFAAVDAAIQPYQTPETWPAGTAEAIRESAAGARVTSEQSSSFTPRAGETASAGHAHAGPGAGPVETTAGPPPPPPPSTSGEIYGGDLFREVDRYARLVAQLAQREHFDLIHAHDWMTFPAAIAIRALTRKPLVVHVHSTEFDRSGLHVNQAIYDRERAGMHAASRVIAVSLLTRSIVVNRYGVDPRKVEVVYNAIDDNGEHVTEELPAIGRDEKIVLFLGRITMQKGPEYFLAAAKKVLEVMSNVRFIMAGTGDMTKRTIELAAEMGIGHRVLFTGFLRGDDVKRVFRMADLYVMPSVSEPFGIAPLEALSNDVPVLISKQSGVAEVLTHALKVDFWDIDEMANKIVAVLRHPPLQATLRDHGRIEVRRLSWLDSARQCIEIYERAASRN